MMRSPINAESHSTAPSRSGFSHTTVADRSHLNGRRLDQFYTTPAVAARCYRCFVERYNPKVFQLVEPSAGKGVFSTIMPEDRIAIDLDPRGSNIIAGDFLTTVFLSLRPIAVLGNPPFGKTSSAAIAFINHATQWAQVIGFILPRTACKAWFVRQLPLDLHLVHEELIPNDAFIANSQVRSVPAIFQIWERRGHVAEHAGRADTHPHFRFTDRHHATLEIQRIGAYAGTIRHRSGAAEASLHFIEALHPGVEAIMSQIDFSDCTNHNAGEQ